MVNVAGHPECIVFCRRGSPSLMVALLMALSCAAARGQEEEAYFEKQVRPLLARRCLQCHSAAERKGGLALDSAAGLAAGADSGPVIDRQNLAESRLLEVISHAGDLKMPPMQKLPEAELEVISAWVMRGANWPEGATIASPLADTTWKKHWAYQPVRHVEPPSIDESRAATEIDAFLLARLREAGLGFSQPADRRTLIRRATFDLLGLPPSPEEVDSFVNDPAQDAYPRLIDRLLESAHYGEHWGRHWLDVARYADSRGYLGGTDARLPFAYVYRDWVVEALNRDLPFDQFLMQQMAADLLLAAEESQTDNRSLAALGFLTLGPASTAGEPDAIDDRLDVIFRGAMGLTVTCARCHDHKYDPVPTADYYSLYGVFAGTSTAEVPLMKSQRDGQRLAAFQAEMDRRLGPRNALVEREMRRVFNDVRERFADYLLAAAGFPPDAQGTNAALAATTGNTAQTTSEPAAAPTQAAGAQQEAATGTPPAANGAAPGGKPALHQPLVDRLAGQIAGTNNGAHRVFGPWHQFFEIAEENFAAEAGPLAQAIAANNNEAAPVNPLVAQLFQTAPASRRDVVSRYAALFEGIIRQWQQATRPDLPPETIPQALEDQNAEEIRQQLDGEGQFFAMPLEEFRQQVLDGVLDGETAELVRAVEAWAQEYKLSPAAPPHALVLVDPPQPVDPAIFVGGDPGNAGEQVPRQFLGFLAGKGRQPFAEGTGRLALARAVASADNPLTARVIVNRVWAWHMGQGLVRTTSDFGLRSEPPSHPGLLDYLAARFIREGWSLKKLHRWIMLSYAYQQQSGPREEGLRIDPENRLLWRMNRRRLEFEPFRDAMLAVSGRLDPTPGGPPVELFSPPYSNRRTLYGLIERGALQATPRVFDAANPKLHSPERYETIVPQQALFLLNSPFAAHQARQLAARLNAAPPGPARVDLAFRLALGRPCSAAERETLLKFIEAASAPTPGEAAEEQDAWSYGRGEVDPRTLRVRSFAPLEVYTGEAWQAGGELPDGRHGWVSLTAQGGHPGPDQARAAIRRFTAPAAGKLSIAGTLEHAAAEEGESDGVRGRIISSRHGALGTWLVAGEEVETNVEAVSVSVGDQIDFVVDCRENDANDGFRWPVTLQLVPAGPAGEPRQFRSAQEFTGPPVEQEPALSPWERLAQVLLMSNEFAFID